MNLVCSLSGIVSPYYPKQGIMDITNAGFENIFLEAGMSCSEYELENYGKPKQSQKENRNKTYCITEKPWELEAFFEKLLNQSFKNNLNIPIARAPYLPRDIKKTDATSQSNIKSLLIRLNQETIKFCKKAGCSYLIIRPWFAGVETEREWEENRAYYLSLADTAKECQVTILIENQCRNFNGHLIRGICSDGQKAAQWVDRLNEEAGEELFGFSMDVGTLNLCGQNIYDFTKALGHRLKAVLLRDCNGNREASLLPFTCVAGGQPQTDWLNVFRGLRTIDFDGQLILSFSDTAAAFSPILRPKLLELAKETGEYFRWQIKIEGLLKKYPSRVLFGAGNMCRNYMKCYGKLYEPLYTCDNNPALWGTEFCGLEVKQPESLKELPDDCAIFICNIYYREIEKQLRDLGVKNPIEFFNDEYMPTFYFDRLEG